MTRQHSSEDEGAYAAEMAAEPGPPVQVGVIDEYELVVAGLVAVLAPYDKRVRVVDLDSAAATRPGRIDIILHDCFDDRRRVDPAQLSTRWGAKLVVFSWNDDPRRVAWALTHGAVGYVLKSLPAAAIVLALERVHAGEVVRPARDEQGAEVDGPAPRTPVIHLTPRETEILQLIATGWTNEQIAQVLFLSINSIKSHIRSAYRKMGVTRRSQAVTWAFVHGVVPKATPEARTV